MSTKPNKNFFLAQGTLDLNRIAQLQHPPAPFTPGETLFWDDPYISGQLLAAHLDPNNDHASRRPETISRSVDWLSEALNLQSGSTVLDLGCGPGLYAARFAERGIRVTGVDYSHRSIEYATQYAQQHHLAIQYRYQNYLDLTDVELYDAAILIYGDFCPLSPAERAKLLCNVHRALKPGGLFALDVTTREHRERFGYTKDWYVAENGFWKPGLHLVLEQGFDYPDASIFLDQAIVIETNGQLSVYRMWFQDFTIKSITHELDHGGFTVLSLWGDMCGTQYDHNTEWIGVIAQKTSR
jgi:SAM-dependent methyltransferase